MNVHIILAIFTTVCLQVGYAGRNSPQDLVSHLMKGYPEAYTYARPVDNSNETITVNFGVALIQINNIDKETGVGSFQTWIRFLWRDRNLQWDPQEFGGQTQAYIPASKIWIPDIRLYNYVYDDDMSMGDVSAIAYHTGDVLWIPPATLRVHCYGQIPGEYLCIFTFGSWVYDGFKLDLDFYEGLEELDISDYINSNTFEIVKHTAVKNIKFYPCCKEPYPDLTFSLEVKKR